MALHTLGKGETQVQFLLGAPSFLGYSGTNGCTGCRRILSGVKFFSVVQECSVVGTLARLYSSLIIKVFIAPVTELVYVLVLETKF